ncbi:uncharacterized protein PG998_005729 [Apiospora kogelbergensis]|uniref:uncharacterized protein n=1 Tax=Apiospora kogelbergensis TaxID=1337665 RepID=UPI003130CC8D
MTAELAESSKVRAQLCDSYPKESQVLQVKITSSVAIALTIPIVIARLVARLTISGRLFSDDLVIVLASALALSADALILATGFLGFGQHLWDVDPANATALLQLVYVGQIVYSLVKTLAKVAILCLIRQVFSQVAWIQRIVQVGFVFYFCSGVAFTTVVVLQCLPIQANWIPSLLSRKCLDIQAVSYTAGALTITEDIFMIILPLPHLFRMQMTIQKKLSVALLFGFAFFATVTSIIRLKYLIGYGTSLDLTWTNVETGMWSMIEVHANIICASLPALWRWFWNIVRAIWDSAWVQRFKGQDKDSKASRYRNNLAAIITQQSQSRKAYKQIHSPEENRMMQEILSRPIPPLTYTRYAGDPGINMMYGGYDDGNEDDYNLSARMPPYQRARRDW